MARVLIVTSETCEHEIKVVRLVHSGKVKHRLIALFCVLTIITMRVVKTESRMHEKPRQRDGGDREQDVREARGKWLFF